MTLKLSPRISVAALSCCGLMALTNFIGFAYADPVLPDPVLVTSAAGGIFGGPNDYSMSSNTSSDSSSAGFDAFGASGASGLLTPFPQLTATASASGSPRDAGASANLSYFGEVVGPTDAIVPILVHGLLATEIDGTGTTRPGEEVLTIGQADIFISSGAENLLIEHACSFGSTSCAYPSGVTIDTIIYVAANVQFNIDMDAGAFALADGAATYSSAVADPTFEINPTFLVENPDFSLAFSPGIGNQSAPTSVPEPFTFSLFGAGLLGAIAMRRTRAKKA